MACVNPFYKAASSSISRLGLYNPYKQHQADFGNIRIDKNGQMWYRIPCGYCLNCRVDKRNWLEDSISYDLNHLYNGVGSFVTLTYDNLHILDNVVTKKDIFGNFHTCFDKNGRPLLTNKLSDGIKFLKRLRSKIKYDNLDCAAIRKDFKYVICTEYGEIRNRCHIHLLLLGLDSKQCFKLYNDCWKKGIVDAGPIKNGGIRYIVDYMDKLPKGKKLLQEFTEIGIEPPKLKHSKGIGRKLIFDNLDFILTHDLSYSCGPFGKTRPIPQYWQKVLCKRSSNFKKYVDNIQDKMNSYQIEKKNNLYSFSEMNRFVAEQSFKLHKSHETHIRNKGNVPPFVLGRETYSNIAAPNKLILINKLANKARRLSLDLSDIPF